MVLSRPPVDAAAVVQVHLNRRARRLAEFGPPIVNNYRRAVLREEEEEDVQEESEEDSSGLSADRRVRYREEEVTTTTTTAAAIEESQEPEEPATSGNRQQDPLELEDISSDEFEFVEASPDEKSDEEEVLELTCEDEFSDYCT